MTDAADNLVRAYDRNHAAIVEIIGEPTFDLNALNSLVEARGHLIEEIVAAGLDSETLSTISRTHARLERAIMQARDDMASRLGKMDAGRRALKAYRR